MARTWGFTRRNRLPLKVLDAVGGRVARARKRSGEAPPLAPAADVRRILVVEFWNIGDVVLATPFLAALRELFPRATITFLGQEHAAEVLAHSDLVDEVVTIDIPWTAATGKYAPRRYGAALRRKFRALRASSFDLAFESRMDPRAKMVLALTGARRRVAYDYGGCNWLLTDAVPVTGFDKHRVDDWAALLAPLGGPPALPLPRLAVSADEAEWARQWLTSRGIGRQDRVVAVHPGASSDIKRWPLERFEQVVREVSSWPGTRVVVIQDPSGYGERLSRPRDVETIRPTLRQLVALLSEAAVLVGNDSGPLHIAAAVGTPTVGVFHPHAAREFAPLGAGHHVLAAPGADLPAGAHPEAATLLRVRVADVVAAAAAALSRSIPKRCAAGS